MTIYNKMKTAFKKHARYINTKREIEALPLDVALDLGIFREDARKIARQAVYG